MSEKKREPDYSRSLTPSRRSQFISDVRLPARRGLPLVGKTLPSYGSLPTAPLKPGAQPSRPQHVAAPGAQKRRRLFTKKRLAVTLILLLLVIGGWLGFKFVSNALKVFHGNVWSVLTITKLRGEDVGRVNILLAGNSADDPGHQGGDLTDSIMIVSIDTKDNTASLLSVPRDLWVSIPGNGHGKINEVYVDGEAQHFNAPGYPSGGMGLLEKVVEQDFGIHINYYALVNYNALRDAVNAVGGVDITIQSSDQRGLYDPSIDYSTHGPLVRLSNGLHHLNGQQALDLARARGDASGSYGFPGSDFDRTEHQRQLLLALKSKALSAGVLANPASLGSLFDSIGKNIRTDFTLGEARRLYDIGKNISNNNVQSVSLNNANGVNLLVNYAAPNGSSALTPAAGLDNFGQIKAFVLRLTSNDPVLKEDAHVVIVNGTSTSGLAKKMSQTLTAKNILVVTVGDAKAPADITTIIDLSNGKKPATLKLLKTLYGTRVTTTNPYAGIYSADFIVVAGNDRLSVSN